MPTELETAYYLCQICTAYGSKGKCLIPGSNHLVCPVCRNSLTEDNRCAPVMDIYGHIVVDRRPYTEVEIEQKKAFGRALWEARYDRNMTAEEMVAYVLAAYPHIVKGLTAGTWERRYELGYTFLSYLNPIMYAVTGETPETLPLPDRRIAFLPLGTQLPDQHVVPANGPRRTDRPKLIASAPLPLLYSVEDTIPRQPVLRRLDPAPSVVAPAPVAVQASEVPTCAVASAPVRDLLSDMTRVGSIDVANVMEAVSAAMALTLALNDAGDTLKAVPYIKFFKSLANFDPRHVIALLTRIYVMTPGHAPVPAWTGNLIARCFTDREVKMVHIVSYLGARSQDKDAIRHVIEILEALCSTPV